MDARTLQHVNLLKKITQTWEIAPQWRLGQLINYLLNFTQVEELIDVPDEELVEACDKIIAERDRQSQAFFYTKPLLIAKFDPTADTYLEIAKMVLVDDDYEIVLSAIVDPEIYLTLPKDLQIIVDSYFGFDKY